jgi:predicted Zn finger-like uncharacterized protein
MKIRCSACRQKYQVPDNYVGKRVRCTQCATVFVAAEDVPVVEDVSFWRGAMADVAKRYGNAPTPADQDPAATRNE